jgi:hypothetical protein
VASSVFRALLAVPVAEMALDAGSIWRGRRVKVSGDSMSAVGGVCGWC